MQADPRVSFQVLDWIMSRRVHEYLDVAGRPVGEGRSAAFQNLHTEMRACPYAGSRYHHAKPMNATALQQMPPWPDVLMMLAWLSRRYRLRHGTEITNSSDLAQVTGAGVWLVDFLVLRRHHCLRSHEIPVLISGLYKVCQGFQLAYLADQFTDATAPTELPDAAGFLAYLEENKLLIGEAEVCSGSHAMITQAYEAILGGNEVAEGALPSSCVSLEIAWEQFDTYTENADSIWRDLVIYAVRMQEFVPQLAEPRLPSDAQERLNALLKQRGVEILAGQKGLVVDIARAALGSGGEPVALPQELPGAPVASRVPEQDGLFDTVFAWLRDAAGADIEAHGPVVAEALQAQLAIYDLYEAEVLAGLNQHLNSIMQALGLELEDPLPPSVLSHLCGRTLRDWGTA